MALSQTLPVSRYINVSVTLTPLAAQFAGFSSLLLLSDNAAINVADRIVGPFSSDTDVAALVGTLDPAYDAAVLYFSQIPTPSNLYLGRWASSATSGLLLCGVLPPASRPISVWTAVTNGGFHISVDGATAVNVTGVNLSGALNLNGVASLITTALNSASVAATCLWNGSQFVFNSESTGPTSSVGFLTAPTSGTDLSAMLLATAATAQEDVPGIASETPLAAVVNLDGHGSFFGIMAASTVPLQTSDHLDIAAYVEGAPIQPHIYGVTTQDATHLFDPNTSTDVASQLSAAGYLHTFCIYSSYSPVAAAAPFGIAFSTNFEVQNSLYTLMYKVCIGLTPENIGVVPADVMDSKRCMYFAALNNDRAILQFGEMSGLAYFDEIHGTDWLANEIQTNIFNVLYTSRKVPQTDPGEHLLKVAADVACDAGVRNGLIAPGQWNAAGVGTISPGDNLPTGYYTYIAPVATQAQADREARKANPIYCLIKLAGAVHTANVTVLVNRAIPGIITTGLALLFGAAIV